MEMIVGYPEVIHMSGKSPMLRLARTVFEEITPSWPRGD